MLRIRNRFRVFRFYHFNDETYNLPGRKAEIGLTEKQRQLQHFIETGEKDWVVYLF